MTNLFTLDQLTSTKKKRSRQFLLSTSQTARQKVISDQLNKRFNEEYGDSLQKIGYERVNFDADFTKNQIVVQKAYMVCLDGEIKIFENENNRPLIGNSIRRKIRAKGMSLAMSVHIPTPILLFNKEIESFFKDGLLLNLSVSALLGGIVALSGVTQETLFNYYILLFAAGLIDYGLHAFPKSVVGKKNKDDKFLAKMWVLLFHMVLMTGMFVVNAFLQNNISNPSTLQNITIHLPFVGMHLLIVPYYLRMLKLFVKVNKIKTPALVTDLKKRIFG